MRIPAAERKAALDEAEQHLLRQLRQEYGAPFIAYYDLPPPLQEKAPICLADEIDGEADIFISQLRYGRKRLAVWTVGRAVAEKYGPDNDHAVYASIERSIKARIPTSSRGRFNREFRTACASLGLTLPAVSPRLCDDYLVQAGIPDAQLAHLVDAFRRAERELSLPLHHDATDDTEYINSWQQEAKRFLPDALPVLRRILREDSWGYHAKAYLRLQRGDKATNSREHKLLEAISKHGAHRRPVRRPPYLTFEAPDLRVETSPQGQAVQLTIETNKYRLAPGESRVLTMQQLRRARWRPSGSDQTSNSILPMADPDGVLVFDEKTGRYMASLRAEQIDAPAVPPGQVALVSARSFQADDVDAHSYGDYFILYHNLSAPVGIRQGEARFTLDIDVRLRLEIDGARIAHCERRWFRADPSIAVLKGNPADMAGNLMITVRHPACRERVSTPVTRAANGEHRARLSLPMDGPFGIAEVSLHVRDERRSLDRIRFWYWPGLKKLRKGGVFDALNIPTNLVREQLKHIVQAHDKRRLQLERSSYLKARLVFEVDHKPVIFEFPPPVPSLFVRNSAREERALEVGGLLTITKEEYASHLFVRCSDRTSAIECNGTTERDAFNIRGLWSKPFAALDGAEQVIRLLPGGSDQAVDLIRVASAANAGSGLSNPAPEVDHTVVRLFIADDAGKQPWDLGSRVHVTPSNAAARVIVECSEHGAQIDCGGQVIPLRGSVWSSALGLFSQKRQTCIRLRRDGCDPVVCVKIVPTPPTEQAAQAAPTIPTAPPALTAPTAPATPAAQTAKKTVVPTVRKQLAPPIGVRRITIKGVPMARCNKGGWLVGAPRRAYLNGWNEPQHLLEVSVEHPAMRESHPVPVGRDDRGRLYADLPLPERGRFGLARVLGHMRHRRVAPLKKVSFWYWPGLKGMRGRWFDAATIPDNVAESRLENIERTDGRLALSADASQACTLAFVVGGSVVVRFRFREEPRDRRRTHARS